MGDNVVGVLLGDGWYSGHVGFYPYHPWHIYGREPQFYAMLILELADGTISTVATDLEWRVARGPRIYSDLLKGERYDASLRMPGWDEAGFNDVGWAVAATGPGTAAQLRGSRKHPIHVTQSLKPQEVSQASDGSYVVDMGQNMVGRVRLTLAGLVAGQVITLRHAEMLNPDGTLYVANLRSAKATDIFVAGEASEETWAPTFTVHGFRYIGITGLTTPPGLEAFSGEVIGNALPETSEFASSSPLLNRLHANILWSQRGNFLAVPTDCPQRDERLGWTADVQVFLPTAAYNMDVQAFLAKWMDDVLDAQSAEGAFPDVALRGPHTPDGGPAWGDAGVIVPLQLFRRYGDRRLLARCYPAMKAWIDYIRRHNPNHIRTKACHWNFGDWLSAGEKTSKPLVATAYYAWVVKLMTEAAQILGITDDEIIYEALYKEIRAAFQVRFLTSDGQVEGETQTAYLLVLFIDLLPDDRKAAAVRFLVANIERHDNHIATGFLGVRHILPILTRYGYAELAYRILLNESYPSWLYPVVQGATTIWERWNGWTIDKGFEWAWMNSFNHYSLGSVGEWLMSTMVGIDDVQDGSAYRHLRLAPVPGSGIDWCRAAYRSPTGWIRSAWRKGANSTVFEFDVPPNADAEIILPFPNGACLKRDGSPAEPKRIEQHNGEYCVVTSVGSGSYMFEVIIKD